MIAIDVDGYTTKRSSWGLSAAPEPWREEALCAQVDHELWYPEKGGSTREAKKVCFNCTVREECLRYALDNDERFGIWGGYSERERRKLKAGQPVKGLQPCGTVAAYQRHIRDGVDPCELCRRAKNESMRKWYRQNRGRAS